MNHFLQVSVGKDFVDVDVLSANSTGEAQLTISKGYYSQKWDHACGAHTDDFHKWTHRPSIPMKDASVLIVLFHLLFL